MLDQQFHNEWLRQHIRGLILGVDLVEGEGSPLSLRPMQPMEVLHIDVLGARTGLGELGNGQGTIVVFKNTTMDGVLVGDNRKSQLLHLHQNGLDRNGGPCCCCQGDELGFSA